MDRKATHDGMNESIAIATLAQTAQIDQDAVRAEAHHDFCGTLAELITNMLDSPTTTLQRGNLDLSSR